MNRQLSIAQPDARRQRCRRVIVSAGRRRPAMHAGFTLLELMIVVVVISILASIAYPAYIKHTIKARRVAAEGCLSEMANYMERYYTTNLSYKKDGTGTINTIPALDCKTSQQTGSYYSYEFPSGSLSSAAYEVWAVPKGQQKSRDTQCGTLTLDQSGKRDAKGTGDTSQCW